MKTKNLFKLTLLSVLLLCGCSIQGLVTEVNPSYSIPALNIDDLLSNNTGPVSGEITAPNGGKSFSAKEFLSYYDDGQNFHNEDYVLDNISKADDDSKEVLESVYNSFKNYSQYHEDNEYSGKYKGYNLITILSETLELHFASPELTPNLWKVMNHGMYFENYYVSEFQEGATCNSEYMAHSGLFPNVDSSWGNNMCQNKLSTNNIFKFSMPAQLSANDYDTYYFHSGYRNFYNRQNFIPNFGFENVKFLEHVGKSTYFPDNELTIFFDKYINPAKYQNNEKNFYVSMLTYSLHGSYYKDSIGVSDEGIQRVYDALNVDYSYFEGNEEVLYYLCKLTCYDDFIGNLISWLEENNLADNTIIAIYRDHHPYMMNQNQYVWYMNEVIEGGFVSTDLERFHHPLIIFEAGNLEREQEIIYEAGSTLDLAPTFLNLLGAQASYRHFHGVDILSGKSYAFLSAQTTSRTNELIIDSKGNIYETGQNSENIDALIYLAIKTKQLEIVTDIINTNYFQYYYYNY